jgi:hypothetical protein
LEKNKVLNKIKFSEAGIGIFLNFNTSDLEKYAFKSSKVLLN